MSGSRHFLGNAIASGLECEILSPDDLIGHVTMDVLAHHLPADLKARLLSASLLADTMTATLVLDTLGVEGIVEHTPAPLLWKAVAEAGQRALGETPSPTGKRPTSTASVSPPTKVAPLATPKPAADDPGKAAGPIRKPNHSTRPPRVRAGATSRPRAMAATIEEDDSAFDVDTRVGAEQPIGEYDVIDESNLGDDVTAHGRD